MRKTISCTKYSLWVPVTLILTACTGPNMQSDVPDVSDVPTVDVPDVQPLDTFRPDSGIGRACEAVPAAGGLSQGDCEDGQVCLPEQFGFYNGYCTADCSTDPCAPGSTCVPLGGRTRLCLKNCQTSADCRADEGYRCQNPGNSRNVCTPSDGPTGLRDGLACFTTEAGPHQLPALQHRTFATANVSLSRERVDTRLQAEGNVVVSPTTGAVATSYIAVDRNAVFMGVSTRFMDDTVQRMGAVRDPSLQTTSDPVLAYTNDGRLHMVFLGYNISGQGQPVGMRLRYTTSADDGRTFATPVGIEPNTFCVNGCDKPWIVVGPTPLSLRMDTDAGVSDAGEVDAGDIDGGALPDGGDSGSASDGFSGPVRDGRSIYVGIMVQTANRAVQLHILRSDDGGVTFTRPMQFATSSGSRSPNLMTPVVDADGTLHVTYAGLASSRFGDLTNRVFYRRSVDGGATWAPEVTVSRVMTDSPVYGQPVVVTEGPRVHVAFVSGNPSGRWEIILATSSDAGMTWTHRKVNDEPESCATHAFPWIVADPMRGRVHAMWLENRFGDGAAVYGSCPTNPAMPCGTNEMISDGPFTFETARDPERWHGDYLGMALGPDGRLWASWSDTRSGTPAMYLARGMVR